MARGKKTEIGWQLRREWLEKYEAGTSIFRLAVEYERDQRTVKGHIERAAREREEKEARVIVVRDALRKHQNKLISYADRLHKSVEVEEPISSELLDDRMYQALKSHLPRSPLWKYLGSINSKYRKLDSIELQLGNKLQQKLASDKKMPQQESVRLGLLEALIFQTISWAKGYSGISIENEFKVRRVEECKSSVEYGSFNLGIIPDGDADGTRRTIERYERQLKNLTEYDQAESTFKELKLLKLKSIEELATIIERGIVPGKCKYCPV